MSPGGSREARPRRPSRVKSESLIVVTYRQQQLFFSVFLHLKFDLTFICSQGLPGPTGPTGEKVRPDYPGVILIRSTGQLECDAIAEPS